MSWVSLIAVYFVLWWLALFLVLPFGIKSADEMNDVTLGTERGAPHQPRLFMKIMVTSVLAAILLAVVYTVFGIFELTLKDFIV